MAGFVPEDGAIPSSQPRMADEKGNLTTNDVTSLLVTWNGPDDFHNPRNWPRPQKWVITFLTSCFTFISPVSSSMLSPALPVIAQDLYITNPVIEMLVVSIFVLGYAIGPLVLGPLSEVYGRVPVLQLSNLFFLVFNTASGFSQDQSQMVIFRFLAGLGGSAPLAIGGGILSDIWINDERGKAMGIYTLMPLLGPAIGPIAAGFIVQYSHWRWCLFSVSVLDVLIQISAFFFLKETSHRIILDKRKEALRKAHNDLDYRTEWDESNQSATKKLQTALVRPFRMLITQPIVQFLSLYIAFLFGLMYLVLSTFPRLWTNVYHQRVDIGGLNYISAGLGFFFGAQVNARLQDRIYAMLKRKADGNGRPEFRIPLMAPFSTLVPVGIFIYAWTAEYAVFWLWPNVGILILSAGMIVCSQCMQIYIVETYTQYAASAMAAVSVLRSLAAFTFPLFATQVYDSLGYGWGNSVLGFIACAIGWPAVLVFWRYGAHLRTRSTFSVSAS